MIIVFINQVKHAIYNGVVMPFNNYLEMVDQRN